MKNYYKDPDYYPDDKDIFDFLNGTNISTSGLYRFLKSLGIFPAPNASPNTIKEYVASLTLDWTRMNRLIDMVSIRDSSERVRHKVLRTDNTLESMKAAIEEVRNRRAQRDREKYKIEIDDNQVKISVDYIDIDSSKTRIIQRREKELTITLEKNDDEYSVHYNSNCYGLCP